MACGLNARRGRTRTGQTCSNALYGDRLWTLVGGRKRLLGRVKRRVEEGVNERGFSEARFALKRVSKGGLERGEKRTDDHGSELETLAHALPVDLVWQVCEADVAHELLANDGGQAGRVLLDGGAGAIGETVGGGRERVDARRDVRVRHVEENDDDGGFFLGWGKEPPSAHNSRVALYLPSVAHKQLDKYFFKYCGYTSQTFPPRSFPPSPLSPSPSPSRSASSPATTSSPPQSPPSLPSRTDPNVDAAAPPPHPPSPPPPSDTPPRCRSSALAPRASLQTPLSPCLHSPSTVAGMASLA